MEWQAWLRRWDAQQEGYVPRREERFTAMFDILAALLPPSFVALDLACGPGSVSQRLLARFPAAHAIAVDFDPVMLAVGQGALGTVGGRLRWVEADLAKPGWVEALGVTQLDAVLSTTALHWLWPDELTAVYRELGRLLRPGGVLLKGDNLAYGPTEPTLARLAQARLDETWSDESFAARGIETAERWWEAFAKEPGTEELLAARTAAYAGKRRQMTAPGYDFHVAALGEAGFSEVGTAWQVLSDRVLLAVR